MTYWGIVGHGPHECWFGEQCAHRGVPVLRTSEQPRTPTSAAIHHIDGNHQNNELSSSMKSKWEDPAYRAMMLAARKKK